MSRFRVYIGLFVRKTVEIPYFRCVGKKTDWIVYGIRSVFGTPRPERIFYLVNQFLRVSFPFFWGLNLKTRSRIPNHGFHSTAVL